MNLKELYQEIILDHGKNPRNLRKTENFNKDAKGHNPLCGDNVHIYLKLNENKKVEDISFEGHGCAISMASASIMTDLVKGKEEAEVKEIDKQNINFYINFIVSALFEANKYFNDQEPWKKKNDKDRLNTIIYTSLEVIRKISFMLYPIIPDSIEKALKIFNLNTKDISLESIATHNNLKVGSNFNKIDILFKKIEKKND